MKVEANRPARNLNSSDKTQVRAAKKLAHKSSVSWKEGALEKHHVGSGWEHLSLESLLWLLDL